MTTRIKLLDWEPATICEAPMPLDDALRWNSRYEAAVNPRIAIFFAQSAYIKCIEHTRSDMDSEVGGALIGKVCIDPQTEQQYILIQDVIPALYTQAGETHVTFTHETLIHLNTELEDRFPGKRMVGWYHTHPRLGVFMSGYDTWLHRHFFHDSTQVALVVDPERNQGGFFCWSAQGDLDPVNYTGFYEWSDRNDDSIIGWTNVSPVVNGAELDLVAVA
ncbi:MAG: Mov34/MPN/PAD-1 family protein [Chloroflexi bacterium]|nr:Mov34/MPN/PAD-1 family protein [Chloroflexota bacterium]